MRRKIVLILILLLLFLVSGCGFKDIDKRFFVVSIGVDKVKDTDQKYRVVLKLVIPSSTEKFGASQSLLVHEEANNITDAIRIMKSKVDKELDFGHLKVILFGEELAKQDITQITDWFTRRRDIQRIAWVGIAKPDVEAIMDLTSKAERLPSNAFIISFGQSGTESAFITSEYLFNFRSRLKERGLDPFLPVIEPPPDKNGMFKTDTVALFDKHRVKVILNPDETKALNAIALGLRKLDIEVGKGKETFMVSAESVKTKYKIDTTGNKPTVVMNVNISGTIEESKSALSGSKLSHYEEMTDRYAGERVLKLLKRLQKENIDPIGFGLRYRATHFNNQTKWEDWCSIYPNVDFKVNVHTELRGTGLIQ